MKKDAAVFCGVLIADIIAVIIAYGTIIEVKGALSIVLWLVPLIGTVYAIYRFFKAKKLMKAALTVILTVYVCASGIFCLREYSYSHKIGEGQAKDGYQYVKYKHSAGAMTSFSYELRQYRVILDTELLSVKIIVNSDFYDSDDYMPLIWSK